MKTILITLLTYLPFFCFSQAQSSSYFVNDLNMKSTRTEIDVTEKGDTIMVAYFDGNDFVNQSTRGAVKKYIGTPYYRNQWFPGTAAVSKDDVSKGLVAFDVVNGKLKFALDDVSKSIELEPYSFEIEGLTFKKLEKEVEKAGAFYYNILGEEDPILVRQHVGSYFPLVEKTEKAYGTTKTKEYEGKFVKRENYYFVVGSQLIPISKKKSLYKALGKYGATVKEIVDTYKLNLNKANDILTLNNLMSGK